MNPVVLELSDSSHNQPNPVYGGITGPLNLSRMQDTVMRRICSRLCVIVIRNAASAALSALFADHEQASDNNLNDDG